jgi:PiT family inorganic phosphate transporter
VETLTVAMVLAGFYVGWNVGANDAANCIGTTVGAGIIPYRWAAVMMAVFVILGGVLQGHHVMKTVGKGIVISDQATWEEVHEQPPPPEFDVYFPDDRLPDLAILVALLSAGFFVTLATFSSLPVSTSQAIVGGVAGVGLGMVGFDDVYFKTGVLIRIGGSWVLSPFLVLMMSFAFYKVLTRLLRNASGLYWTNVVAAGVIVSAAYVSYSLGANDVGNAIGPLLARFPDEGLWLAVLGGVAMATGALTFGYRVTHTVGNSITPLDYPGALAAHLSAAIGVHGFSMLGIPVSTSQAVIGGVLGVGLTSGMRAVDTRTLRNIVIGWVVTPTLAAVFAALVYALVRQLLV